MEEEKLLPCPMCGKEAELCKGRYETYWIVCSDQENCGINQSGFYSKAEAIERWNRRVST